MKACRLCWTLVVVLAVAVGNCVACHATYRFVEEPSS
jgi:hypothetical protein